MTYFKGIDHPDQEPTRNRFSSDPKRKSRFTEEVAKTVKDGDLYFSMRTKGHQRYYLPVDKGEHELEEPGLICVTHKFRKPYPDIKGRWEPYDGHGNLVIKLNSVGSDERIVTEAMQAVELALYRTPLGRLLGRDALRDMAESLCKTLGLENDDAYARYGEARSTFIVNTIYESLARDALRELLTYAPEGGYDKRLGRIGADSDGVGFAQNAKKYAEMINGESDGFDEPYEKPEKPLPLLSQPVFYAVLGSKGNGRSFNYRLEALKRAVGLTDEDL